MESTNKWVLFKNYLHNELGVTKEDIRAWIHDAVKEVAREMVAKSFDGFDPNEEVRKLVEFQDYWGNEDLREEIKKMVAARLAEKLVVTTK